METYFGLQIKVKKVQSAQDIACRLFLSPRITAQQVESILVLIDRKQLSYEALISKTDDGIAELKRWKESGEDFSSDMRKKYEEWALKFKELSQSDYEYIEKTYGFTKSDLLEGPTENHSQSPHINCARELANYVKQYIKGQDEAIEKLSVPFWQHLDSKRSHYTCKIKTPVLLMGPTGVGKSEILRLFASACDCPVIRINTADIAPSGWGGGTHISDIIAGKISDTVTISDLEYAIIVIHEVDKITHYDSQIVGKSGTSYDADVMRNIMRFFETEDSLHLDKGFDGKQMTNVHYELPIDNLFLVFDGAFDGIEAIIKRRLNINNTIGFKTQASKIHKGTYIPSLVTSEDLIEWGFKPELIGRIGNYIVLNSLTTEDIYQIMVTAKENILQSHIDYCAHNHIELRITEGALHYIASEAYKSGLGFRNVKTLLAKALNRIYYDLPGKEAESDNILVEVTKEYVMKNLSSKQL